MMAQAECKAGVKELSGLIERENEIGAAGIRHMSDLADSLLTFERATMAGQERVTASPTAKAEYVASKRGCRVVVPA